MAQALIRMDGQAAVEVASLSSHQISRAVNSWFIDCELADEIPAKHTDASWLSDYCWRHLARHGEVFRCK